MSTILSIIGVVCMGIAVSGMYRQHQFLSQAAITDGRVIELLVKRGSKGGKVYVPKVGFAAPDGREITFQERVASSSVSYRVGDPVKIAFSRDNVFEARLLDFGYRFGGWYCLLGMGLLLLFIDFGFKHGNDWVYRQYVLNRNFH